MAYENRGTPKSSRARSGVPLSEGADKSVRAYQDGYRSGAQDAFRWCLSRIRTMRDSCEHGDRGGRLRPERTAALRIAALSIANEAKRRWPDWEVE